MRGLLERVRTGETLVADGAMGSLLIDQGLRPGDSPEALNISRPELLADIARRYCEAGAEIVQTNTFGGSPLKLAMYGLDGRTEEINWAAVGAVRGAVDGRAYISGSCGPCGKTLKPYGDTPPEEVRAAFVRQMRALVGAGVDLLCIETMTDLTEATLAIAAAREVGGDMPVVATMTFDPTPRGFYTIMGNDIPSVAAGLASAGADIIGSNCGNGSENMVKIASEMRKHTSLPLIIQSNAGLPQLEGGRAVYRETPEFMAVQVPALIAAKVAVIGGCCGTTPDHVRALRAAVGTAAGKSSGV